MKISSAFLLYISGLTAFLLFCNTVKAVNLILNPGFEELSSNKPTHWTLTGPIANMQPVISIDDQIHYSGSYGLKMESTNPYCHGRAVQNVTVTGGQTYQLSARFKTANIKSIDKSVIIRVKWFHNDTQVAYNYVYEITGASNGWLLTSNKISAISNANRAEISLEFRWGTGTVWWDEISFESCATEPARNVKVGTVYCRPPGSTVQDNINMMSGLLDQAGASGCQIVCLPEGWVTCNTGLGSTKVEANSLEGSASVMMSQKAVQYGMYIVSGLYCWFGDTLNNIGVLYNREGKIQGVYKKVQLPDSEAEAGKVPGDSLLVFTTDFGKIGILICWDFFFPEVSRILALKGAEILFCPIWGDIRGTDIWKITARSRAVDNGVYFVTSIYDGHSLIVNPAGDILQESGIQETLITANIDLNFNPPWYWTGNAGLATWKDVWRKDRRSDIFGDLGNYITSSSEDYNSTIITRIGNDLYSPSPTGNQWYDDNGIIAGATSQTYSPTADGNYYCIVTGADECESDTSNVIHIEIAGLSEKMTKVDNVTIYPNPAKTFVTIDIADFSLKDNYRMQLFDIYGTLLHSSQIMENKTQINTSGLTCGIYMIQVMNDKDVMVRRFIEE